jgi:tetratricopeptide (TPR) repeat protein
MVSLTAFFSRMYHKQVHTLADRWFTQGERDMQAGNISAALTDYRNALAYNPYNTRFQFSLAKALAASGHYDEARAYLLNLLSESPGRGEVNLELARIAAHNNLVPDAVRYYQGAIYGEWDADPIETRWQIRRELCEFLLDHGVVKQATPEVIALAENTPLGDSQRLKIVGELLLRARQWTRAQEVYRDVLAADRYDEEALATLFRSHGIFQPVASRTARRSGHRRVIRYVASRSGCGSVLGGTSREGESAARRGRSGYRASSSPELRAPERRVSAGDFATH